MASVICMILAVLFAVLHAFGVNIDIVNLLSLSVAFLALGLLLMEWPVRR